MPDIDGQTSHFASNGDVYVEELHSNIRVDKGETTALASSSKIEQGSSELPLVLDVMVSNTLALLQKSSFLVFFVEVIQLIAHTYCVYILNS